MNWHHIDRLYNLESSRDANLTLRNLCNQLIHSYVFVSQQSSQTGPVKAIMFSSDHTRAKHLFEVSLCDLAEALEIVGHDYPARSEAHFDKNMGDYRIKNWTPSE